MKVLFRELFRALVVGTAIYVVFLIIFFFLGRPVHFNRELRLDFMNHLLFSTMLYLANAYVLIYGIRYFGSRLFSWKLLLMAIMANVLVSVAAIFMANLITEVILGEMAFERFLDSQSVADYAVTVFIALVVCGIFYLFYYYKNQQENRVQEQKIIAGTAAAQFDALKNQLDPHFLFNSLNVLSGLIDEDPRRAQHFTTALSKVYRYVLEQKHKELVSLEEEFDFARTYINLLNMRFEDSLIFSIPDTVRQSEGRIVPLSLQLLLENAVKHNVATSARPLRIEIREGDGVLEVVNNLQQRQTARKSVGVGLQNIQERYKLLSDRKIELYQTESEFRVVLPVLINRISSIKKQETLIADKRYERARAKLEAVKGFYGNLAAYILVIPVLIWINYSTTSFPWAIFPALGWGFGLLMHGMEAYGVNPLWGKRWEERKIRELMEREDF